jgi:predicted ATPase/DNA-binding XRE family transcriptional regulator
MHSSGTSTFGELLRDRRRAAELTQEELAERAALSRRTVSDLERGLYVRPHRDTVRLLAQALTLGTDDEAAFLAAARRLPHDQSSLLPDRGIHPTNLPDDPTPFIGRTSEIIEVAALLGEPDVRLVTLTGPGGTGKTRLALQVGNTLLYSFRDGVFFVDLAPLSDPGLVVSTIAETLGVKMAGNATNLDSLTEHLLEKHLLLVVDNCEHVLDAAPELGKLLDICREVHVLTTSRIPLHLIREREYAVAPLPVPDSAHLPPLEQLRQYDAIALFHDRASASKHAFSLSEEDAAVVAEICIRLDGMPLAIELAAARIKLFPPQVLLGRLDHSLSLLTGGARDRPSRQRTLRNTIDWSYSLLTAEEQVLFARLSVFVGGCTFEAAETVFNPEGDLSLLDEMASLVDQSLIRQEGEDEPRFSMFETIREYASDKLIERGEEALMRDAHAIHYLEMAERAELNGTAGVEWFRRLDSEFPNIAAATAHFLDGGQAESALRLVSPLYPFWTARSYARQALRWLEIGLRQGEAINPRVRARALLALGGISSVSTGDIPLAITSLTAAVPLLRAIGDDARTARARIWLGMCATSPGKYEEAEAELMAALDLAREIHDVGLVSLALAQLGNLERERKEFQSALKWYEEALSAGRIQANAKGLSLQLIFVADLLIFSGRLDEAEARYEESLSRAREVAWQGVAAEAMVGIGHIALLQGRHARAREHLSEGLLLSQASEDVRTLLLALLHMAVLATALGEVERAGILLGAEAGLCETLDIPLDIPLEPLWQGEWERTKHSVQQALGDDSWALAQAKGRAMSQERIVVYAVDHIT